MLTFSLKQMILRKITIDNNVKYIPSTNSSPSEILIITNQNLFQILENQAKLLQKNKEFIEVKKSEGFRILKGKMNCNF